MARTLVSLLRRAPGAPRGSEPSLEANAYAVSQDVDLTVVLLEEAVRLAIAGAETRPGRIADATFPPSAPAHDLRALLESGIPVLAHDRAIASRGLTPDDLVAGVEVVSDARIAGTMAQADGVLTW